MYSMTKRPQEIERLYMTQLVNIESSVYVLSNKLRQLDNRINQLNTPIARSSIPKKPVLKSHIGAGFLWIIAAIIFPLVTKLFFSIFNGLFGWLYSAFFGDVPSGNILAIISAILFLCIGLYNLLSGYKKYLRAEQNYNETIKNNQIKDIQNAEQTQLNYREADNLVIVRQNMEKEFKQARAIRNHLYNVDWIPTRYRDIHVAYYVYDCVCHGNFNIEKAIELYLHQLTNDKLDQLLQKMDVMIENQKEGLLNQAKIDSQNRIMIAQNNRKLNHLANIEQNTQQAAEYSRFAASYSEVTAYFSWARYIGR